jgi:glutamate racemase
MEYEKKLKTADPVVNVVSQSCPLFVPLVEEGWLDGTIAEDIAKIYLKPITSANIDTLVLGCTHYPLLKPLLQSQIGNEIKIIDSAYPVANKIDRLITSTEIQTEKNSKGDLSCFITDILSQFESTAERFLDSPVTTVSRVTLE